MTTLDPVETLGILVEAAVAIAGFSGVVVVFGQRATGEWSELDRANIHNLLHSSFTVLFLSLAALLLLHSGIGTETTWRIASTGSAVILFLGIPRGIRIQNKIRHDPNRAGTSTNVVTYAAAALFIILNIWNASMSGQFWPFLASEISHFGGACYSFAALLFPQSQNTSADS